MIHRQINERERRRQLKKERNRFTHTSSIHNTIKNVAVYSIFRLIIKLCAVLFSLNQTRTKFPKSEIFANFILFF